MKLCDGLAKTCFTCVELRAELRDGDSFFVPRLPSHERRREFVLLVLVDTFPSRCQRQLVKSSGIHGNPSFQSSVIAAAILGFDSGRMLINSREFSIEGFTCQKIFKLGRFS